MATWPAGLRTTSKIADGGAAIGRVTSMRSGRKTVSGTSTTPRERVLSRAGEEVELTADHVFRVAVEGAGLGGFDADETSVPDLGEDGTVALLATSQVDGGEHAVVVELVDAVQRREQVGACQAVDAVGLHYRVHRVAEGDGRRPRLGAG